MAGLYPDAPGRKFPYDVDGSVGFLVNSSSVITLATPSQLANGNDEALSASASEWPGVAGSIKMGLIFPELRDILGYFFGIWNVSGTGYQGNRDDTGTGTFNIETSVDTTNGLDGTWTNRVTNAARAAGTAYSSVSRATMRNTISSVSWTGIKAVRFVTNFQFGPVPEWSAVHFYGELNPLSGDRLTLWHPTLDQALSPAALDFGDVQRSTTTDKTFRVKNLSAGMTANSILLAVTALTDGTPTYVSQYTLGLAGSFSPTQTISSLAPGAISAVYTLRLITTASAALSVYRQRLSAVATTWS